MTWVRTTAACWLTANATGWTRRKDRALLGIRQTAAVASLLAGGLADAWAQAGIYTCVDARGRRLTSDRPIVECLDRQQKELGADGTVKRVIGPSLTAEERAAQEAKARKEADEKQRAAEEKRRERVLLARYPDRATHDRERQRALDAVEDVIATAHKRSAELAAQRKKLVAETEFFKADPAKTPASLKRQLEENEQHLAAQNRFLQTQEEEKRRVNARFDEELAQLKQLWSPTAAAPAPRTTRH